MQPATRTAHRLGRSSRFARAHSFIAAAAVAAVATCLGGDAAAAGSIDFSGRTWNTLDQTATAQYEPDQANSYAGSVNTGTFTGRFGIDTVITTPVTVNVGDKFTYDYVLTTNNVDLGNDGASQWIGDSYATFRTGTNFYDPKVTGHAGYYWFRDLWFSNASESSWINAGPNASATGVRFEWSFPTALSYEVKVWNGTNTGAAPVATYAGDISDVADIHAFRLALWDSEQTVSIANFKQRPSAQTPSGLRPSWSAGNGQFHGRRELGYRQRADHGG